MAAENTTPKRRWPGRLALLVLLLLVAAGAWFVASHKVWTDDRTIHVANNQAKVREVLWDAPKPLGPQFDSDSQQYEPSVSPDGTELYFVRGKPGKNVDIFVSYRRNNAWTTPEPLAAVNSSYDDLGPRLSADGKLLFFYSGRPGGLGGYDIWASPRTADGWGEPFNLGPTVNSEFNEFTPDPTPDGKHLIFATNRTAAKREQAEPWRATIRENGAGDYDLWIADLDEAKTLAAQAAGPATQPTDLALSPSTPGEGLASGSENPHPNPLPEYRERGHEAAAPSSISSTQPAPTSRPAVEDLLGFVRSDVQEFVHPATQPQRNARVTLEVFQPAHEIPGINTPYVEGASCMSPAGDFLYFCSNRPGGFGKFDIWRSRVSPDWKFSAPENLGPEINTADNETDPALALNGYRLVFSSDRGSAVGRYSLLSSDSREVYSQRQLPPLPHASLNLWLLIASLLVLVPLLLFLKGWDDRHMGLLQKCLLISLLVHALLTFVFSLMSVVVKNYPQAGKDLGIEAVVSFVTPRDAEIGMDVRRQSSSDLPTAGAAPSALRQTNAPLESVAAPGPVEMAVPQAHATPGPVALAIEPPKAAPPTVTPESVAIKPVAPRTDVLDVRIRAPEAVSQAEVKPQVEVALPKVDRAARIEPDAAPQMARTDAAPTARPEPAPAITLAQGPAAKPNLPSSQEVVNPDVASAAAPAVNIDGPKVTADRVAAAGPQAPAAMEAPLTAARQQIASAPVAPAEIGSAANVPKAFAETASLAQAVAAGPRTGINAPPDSLPSPTIATGVEGPNVAINPAIAKAQAVEASPAVVPSSGDSKAASMAPLATGQPAGIGGPAQIATATVPTTSAGGPGAQPAMPATGTFRPHAGPTARPTDVVAVATGGAPDGPNVGLAAPSTNARHSAPEAQLAAATPSGGPAPTTRPSDSIAGGPAALSSGNPVQIAMAAGSVKPDVGSSFAQAPSVTPRVGVSIPGASQPGPAAASLPGALEGPQIALNIPVAPVITGGGTPGAGVDAPASPEAVAFSSKQAQHGPKGGGSKSIYLDVTSPASPGGNRPAAGTGMGPHAVPVRAHLPEVVSASPDASVSNLPDGVGPGRLAAPDSPFKMRAPEVRKPIIEQIGGTKESEDAVDRGLAWLASVQEDDGHWGYVPDDARLRRRQRSNHDMGLTGLSTLAFLAQNHRPDQAGPYRQTVAKSLDYLIAQQFPDGDLRGPSPGGSSEQANMYDHAIATLAIGEAAQITRDPRYVEAALRAAHFIVSAQDTATGGWRYLPQQAGDSSVFGWQVMALHSAEQVGFQVPASTRRGMFKFLDITSSGRHGMLAGYLPASPPTATMTAQVVFTRMLLGQELNEAEMREAVDFLRQQPPDPNNADIYYWYYASLSMQQMQSPAWKAWNERTRDLLVRMQHKDGAHAGYWDTNVRRGDRGGRVFTTSIATLTLEVYYRYMPMKGADPAPPIDRPLPINPNDLADDRAQRPADQRKPQRDKRYLEPN